MIIMFIQAKLVVTEGCVKAKLTHFDQRHIIDPDSGSSLSTRGEVGWQMGQIFGGWEEIKLPKLHLSVIEWIYWLVKKHIKGPLSC